MDTKKFRGSRTCGGGTHKNRRGAGNRGGRGKAGGCKHHFVRAMMRGYSYGKHGFKRPAAVSRDVSIVNVGELDELAPYLVEEGLAEIKDGAYHINLENLGNREGTWKRTCYEEPGSYFGRILRICPRKN